MPIFFSSIPHKVHNKLKKLIAPFVHTKISMEQHNTHRKCKNCEIIPIAKLIIQMVYVVYAPSQQHLNPICAICIAQVTCYIGGETSHKRCGRRVKYSWIARPRSICSFSVFHICNVEVPLDRIGKSLMFSQSCSTSPKDFRRIRLMVVDLRMDFLTVSICLKKKKHCEKNPNRQIHLQIIKIYYLFQTHCI